MSHLPIRKTVPPVRSAINITNAATKRTTAMVLTASGETVPGTVKRGLLAIENAKRTATATAITTTIVIYATATISATIRIGSTMTRTVYISRKALLALT